MELDLFDYELPAEQIAREPLPERDASRLLVVDRARGDWEDRHVRDLPALLAGNGWVGQFFEPYGIQLAFNPNGVVIALIFIGLPFVVRTVQPVLEDTEKELEEAATSLGATRWQIFRHVILPSITPALLTGFAMAFARAIGEYGSVIFIAGNMPMVSEITPLIIIGKLEQYDYAGATAVATVMLVISFILLLIINGLQAWQRKRSGA